MPMILLFAHDCICEVNAESTMALFEVFRVVRGSGRRNGISCNCSEYDV